MSLMLCVRQPASPSNFGRESPTVLSCQAFPEDPGMPSNERCTLTLIQDLVYSLSVQRYHLVMRSTNSDLIQQCSDSCRFNVNPARNHCKHQQLYHWNMCLGMFIGNDLATTALDCSNLHVISWPLLSGCQCRQTHK